MSKQLSTSDVIASKKRSIRKLNNYLEACINNQDVSVQKKAYLISSWLNNFVSMVSFEDRFDPKRNVSYKRGNVIKADFGFNIGCELGGLHYAIVLDKNNKHSSDTVTVIPLTSIKDDKSIYERDIALGSELYNTLLAKYNNTYNILSSRINELEEYIKLLDVVKSLSAEEQNLLEKEYPLTEKIDSLYKELLSLREEVRSLTLLEKEIQNMKEGSIAKIEQITTISKIRIYIPKKTTDVLYNISFSENAMKKINDKIKELYVFDN